MIVPHKLTPIPVAGLPELIDNTYHSVLGTCPGVDACDVLLAHLEFEHGLSRNDGAEQLRGVWNFNIGNVDATMADRADPDVAVFITVSECEGTACQYQALHTRRAFATVEDGAIGYVEAMRDRFPDALFAASEGPRPFVAALKSAGYFTGDVDAYADGVVALLERIQRERLAA